ncbi:hypothetical protein H5410_060478 [Solanum commersonii]|uniref:Uncharacterized protein n=1 Tax=Solanum commersonii TaxID=4109 RepID=A0A9J5W655_SOLCO|nr:hypothetical protein H5410_060478 [Solanum commersonii]
MTRDCKVKDKIKSLDLEDNIKDSLYKNLLNSSSENSSPNNNDGEESSTSEDLKVFHEEDCMSSSKEECTNDNLVEILMMIDDPMLRPQIIDKIGNTSTSTSNTRIPKENSAHNNAYTMTEKDHFPTTIQYLVEEINNLKKEISSLKNHNMILDERITYTENKDNNHHRKYAMVEGNLPDILEGTSIGISKINTEHPMYTKFMDFIQSREPQNNAPPSYSALVNDEANENIEVYDKNEKDEVICLLKPRDLQWRDDPWKIMTRYFDTASYVAPTYKYIMHYQIILSSIRYAEF